MYIIEQSNDERKFNRGKLLNIGFDLAQKNRCRLHRDVGDVGDISSGGSGNAIVNHNIFIFHDVDLLPTNEQILAPYYTQYPTVPIHIARVWDRYSNNEKYFGGIVSFSANDMQRINGYPNTFWGWGGEDDEMQNRCEKNNIKWIFPSLTEEEKRQSEAVPVITDLEDMTIKEKLTFLRANKVWKCNVKWEALDEHEKTWETNGLKDLKYDVLSMVELDKDRATGTRSRVTKVTVDVQLNGDHWSNDKCHIEGKEINMKQLAEQKKSSLEPDEPVWKPDEDENDYNGVNDSNQEVDDENMWQPQSNNDDDNMWQPQANNDDDTMWQPQSNNDNDNNMWQPNSNNDDNHDMSWQPIETNENATDASDHAVNKKKNTFHANSGAAAADKFYSELTRSLDTRSESKLYHMRNFNGWVKATQIAELNPNTNSSEANGKKRKRSRHPLRILDLACGKGGDLGKWILHNRGVQSYVGSDVARGSLVDAALRARNMRGKLKNKCTFICADLGSDVPGRPKHRNSKKIQRLLSWSLENDNGTGDPDFSLVRGGGLQPTDKFDVISIQFAIHYMMSSEKRARRFFQTVSELLDIGGNLIATTIDARMVMNHMMNTGYNFHFDDDNDGCSDSDEFITIKVGEEACQLKFHRDVVKQLFQSSSTNGKGGINPNLFGLEYTFTLVEGQDHASGVGQAVDLAEWLTPLPVLKTLAEEAGLTMEYASNFHEFYEERKDPHAHHAAHSALYNMNVLNRNGSLSDQEWDISRMYMAIRFRKDRESSMIFEDDDGMEDEGDMEDEDEIVDGIEDDTKPNNSGTASSSDSNPKLAAENVSRDIKKINMSDPKVMKMYTKAMAKARMTYTDFGDWALLTSDEKKDLIHEELVVMMASS